MNEPPEQFLKYGGPSISKEQPKSTIKEPKPEMIFLKVKKKNPIKQYGQYGQYKFYALLTDGDKSYHCMFHVVHRDSFDVGDSVGIEYKPPDRDEAEHSAQCWLKIYKKHDIYNETKSKLGGSTSMKTRPLDEINRLLTNSHERYKEVSRIISHEGYGAKSEEGTVLHEEQVNLRKLIGFLMYALNGQTPNTQEFSLDNFKSCSIITRHFRDKEWDAERLYWRTQDRLNTIRRTIQNHTNSIEYVDMNKLYVALAWLLDQMKDCQIGLNFTWSIFQRKVKDDYQIRGIEADEWNTKERTPLIDQAARAVTYLQKRKIEQNLDEKFDFLKQSRLKHQK